MIIVNDVLCKKHKLEHDNNVREIVSLIKSFTKNQFKDCCNFINRIVISDDIKRVNNEYGYDINIYSQGTVHKTSEGYDIVFNYNKLITVESGHCYLVSHFKTFIYHEFCHIKDHYRYDDIIIIESSKYNELEKFIGKNFFLEFIAQYEAQLYEPLVWDYNKYELGTNTLKFHKMHENIINQIAALTNHNLNNLKSNIIQLLKM